MNLKVTPTEDKDRWHQISNQVEIITKDYLWRTFGVDYGCLRAQDGLDFAKFNSASLSLLDRWFCQLRFNQAKSILTLQISEFKERKLCRKPWRKKQLKTKARLNFVGCFHSQIQSWAHFLLDLVSSTIKVSFNQLFHKKKPQMMI